MINVEQGKFFSSIQGGELVYNSEAKRLVNPIINNNDAPEMPSGLHVTGTME